MIKFAIRAKNPPPEATYWKGAWTNWVGSEPGSSFETDFRPIGSTLLFTAMPDGPGDLIIVWYSEMSPGAEIDRYTEVGFDPPPAEPDEPYGPVYDFDFVTKELTLGERIGIGVGSSLAMIALVGALVAMGVLVAKKAERGSPL